MALPVQRATAGAAEIRAGVGAYGSFCPMIQVMSDDLERRAEPWLCPQCDAEIDQELDQCWRCGALPTGEFDPGFVPVALEGRAEACRVCGYDFRGLAGAHCPECGGEVDTEIRENPEGARPGADAQPVEWVEPRSLMHDLFVPRYSAITDVKPNRVVLVGTWLIFGSSLFVMVAVILTSAAVGEVVSDWPYALALALVSLFVIVRVTRSYLAADERR